MSVPQNPTWPAGEVRTYALIGECVVFWNYADKSVREILIELTSNRDFVRSFGARVLVSEMGTRQVASALETFAESIIIEPWYREHIAYLAKLYSACSGLRNLYVHGVDHVTFTHDGSGNHYGQITGWSAKGSLKSKVALASVDQLKEFVNCTLRLQGYASALAMGYHLEFDALRGPPPQKPELPTQPQVKTETFRLFRP